MKWLLITKRYELIWFGCKFLVEFDNKGFIDGYLWALHLGWLSIFKRKKGTKVNE